MHIPDGFLSTETWVSAWGVSLGGLWVSVRQARKVLKEKMVPLMGVMSAFVFAAQMVNFPVAGGTSGHLLGGVLVSVLLGPWAGAIVIAVVLVAQCLIFQDGGLTALGANILNMSMIGTAGGYFIYGLFRRFLGGRIVAAAMIAAWISVVLASSACAVELAISGTSPLKVALPSMALIHAVIGIGEALITGLVLRLVIRVRPDLIYKMETR